MAGGWLASADAAFLWGAGSVSIRLDLVQGAHAQDAVTQDSTGAGDNLVFSEEKVKQLLTAAVQRLTGRELSIRGDLDIDLGWQTTVSANDVSFANAEWAETPNMLTVKSLRARIDIGALLEGRIVAPSIELDQPQVILAINKQGESNLPTLAGKEEQAKEPFELTSIPVVRHVAVRDGTIIYKDMGADTQLEAQIAKLSLEAQENQPITVSGQAPTMALRSSLERMPGPGRRCAATTVSLIRSSCRARSVRCRCRPRARSKSL
jgi:hypothetical protein